MRTKRSLPFALLCVLLATGCTAGPKSTAKDPSFPIPQGGSRVAHAVQSAELREAMYSLEKITTNRLPEELGHNGGRRVDLERVAALADTLARTAAEIPDALIASPLPPDEERRFRELAEQLVRDAFALRDRAILGEVGSARDETEQLLSTCNACHSFARVPRTASAPSTANNQSQEHGRAPRAHSSLLRSLSR